MKYSEPHLNKDCRPYSNDNLYTSRYATLPGPVETGTRSIHIPNPTSPEPDKPATRHPEGPSLPPLSTYTPPPHPFRTPIEAFQDGIGRRLDDGTISPAKAQSWRVTFEAQLAHHMTTLNALPAGTISPIPDPDTAVPVSPPPVIDLVTPLPTIINLITPTPETPNPQSTPPWPKWECSPRRTETATKIANQVDRIKGRQAVQGASPTYHTEESLRVIPAHSPDPSGTFGRYTPDDELTPISQLTNVSTPANDIPLKKTSTPTTDARTHTQGPGPTTPSPLQSWHQLENPAPEPTAMPAPLDFGAISPPPNTDSSISDNLPDNKEPVPQGHFRTNPQRQRLITDHFKSDPPAPSRPREQKKTGANASRVRKNGTMSRHQHTKTNMPLTHTNTNPLSSVGDISVYGEELEEAQTEALFQLAD